MTRSKTSFLLLTGLLALPASAEDLDGVAGLSRSDGVALRIASYNVYWGSVFPQDNGEPPLPEGKRSIDDRTQQFIRVHQAVLPDVWALQEVLYSEAERQTKTVAGMERYFSAATGVDWHTAADNNGRMVFSRYPIKWQKEVAVRVFGVLIDVPQSVASQDVLLLNLHLGGGTPVSLKSAKDAAAFLQRVLAGKVPEVPDDVMVVVCGDFNCRSHHKPYRILRSLDPNVAAEGELEWVLQDAHPRHLELQEDATIGKIDLDSDPPVMIGNRIDYVLYRPDRLDAVNSFILNTVVLDDETLERHNLIRNDVAVDPNDEVSGKLGLDHLPLVVDFRVQPTEQ